MKLPLHAAWSQRLKLWAEGSKLSDEGDKLRAEGDKLRSKGNKLWAEAVINAYGNGAMSWTWKTDHGECTLKNGDVYCGEQSGAEAPPDRK